jgi:hypothetical protein
MATRASSRKNPNIFTGIIQSILSPRSNVLKSEEVKSIPRTGGGYKGVEELRRGEV